MNSHSVVIIDYGVGNLTSVKNAFSMIGVEALVTSDTDAIKSADKLILPGVGAFGASMDGLRARGLIEVLRKEVLEKKKPILGICLGMQLFATKGFEYGEHEGLGFIEGSVKELSVGSSHMRLPHIGWNDVAVEKEFSLTKNFDHVPTCYFLHSFHMLPLRSEVIAGTTEYGDGSFVSVVEQGNIFGVQFHPEKSHVDGLQFLKNFIDA